GDQAKTVENRDEIYLWEAPFADAPKSFFKTKQRFSGIDWSNGGFAIVSDSWYDTRNTKSYLIDLNTNSSKLIEDRNYQDVYQDPGTFNTTKNQFGRTVIDAKNNKAYLVGEGFTKNGQYPFIDEIDMNSICIKRIYTSKLYNYIKIIIDILNKKNDSLIDNKK